MASYQPFSSDKYYCRFKFSIDSNSWPDNREPVRPEEFKNIKIMKCLEFNWFLDCEELLVIKH